MKKIIFDTDLGGDCDDVMALDLLIAAHKNNECDLLGITYCWTAFRAPECIRAITSYHGISVPIGSRKTENNECDIYATAVAEAFPEYTKGEVQEAIPMIRRILSKEKHVTIVATGNYFNLSALLKSKPDEFSPLDGIELVSESVDEIVVMGGNFSHQTCLEPIDDPELAGILARVIKNWFHKTTDYIDGGTAVLPDGTILRLPEANIFYGLSYAKSFFELCPVPVTVSPFECGYKMKTGAPMCAAGLNTSPDSLAYVKHGSVNGQDSWDPSAAYYAIYGAFPYLRKTSCGKITVDDCGITDFHPNIGKHSLIYPAVPKSDFAKEMDNKVMRLYKQ